MLKLTRLADYAVVIMSHLAQEPDRVHRASAVAQDTGLQTPTVSKVLGVMSRGGLVTSQRGQTGGFKLSHPPADISVADVVGLVDGPVALTECVEESHGHCGLESRCNVRGYFQKINDAVRRALDEVTLADLACPALTFPMHDADPMPDAGPMHDAGARKDETKTIEGAGR